LALGETLPSTLGPGGCRDNEIPVHEVKKGGQSEQPLKLRQPAGPAPVDRAGVKVSIEMPIDESCKHQCDGRRHWIPFG
jgi:hypothetical protein